MQDADIEKSACGLGIGKNQIFRDGTFPKALAGDGDVPFGEDEGLRRFLVQDGCVFRKIQGTRDFVGGIVVSLGDHDPDSLLVQAPQLIAQEKGDLHIGIVLVVQVSGEDQEGDPLFDGQVDQPFKGVPCCPPDTIELLFFPKGQIKKGTVQMNIGRMQEFHAHLRDPDRFQTRETAMGLRA